jgi:RNA polymerase sigma-70 factor (ECF subfamily)
MTLSDKADDEAAQLLARWRSGDQQAATELFRHYADRLVGLARSQLSRKVGQRLDAEDVVQSVYRSFFADARAGRYQIQRGGDLWRLLVTITLCKVRNQAKHSGRAKRAVDRDCGFGSEDSLLGIQPHLLAREPGPLEAAALSDELEHLLQGQEPLYRRIVELRLQGCKLAEIAAQVERSQRTVCRVLEEVKQQLEQAWAEHSRS